MTPAEFVAFYLEANGGRRRQTVTRIEFEYLERVGRRRRQATA